MWLQMVPCDDDVVDMNGGWGGWNDDKIGKNKMFGEECAS
jgi:hypothetical protein